MGDDALRRAAAAAAQRGAGRICAGWICAGWICAGLVSMGLTGAGLMGADPALAQSGAAPDWPEFWWNPNAEPDDLVLPLPCGGAIALRPVATPTGDNWLEDVQFQVGRAEAARDGVAYAEAPRYENVVGSISEANDPTKRLYYIGKYEVTRDQYAAVSQPCDQVAQSDDGSIPIDQVAWYDAVAFTRRLTEWLNENAPGSLPQSGGERAFVRLPTEAEWEFAARGGAEVGVEQRRDIVFFEADAEPADYAWHNDPISCAGDPQPVGELEPNPLLLYDILGNVAELVLEPYRMHIAGRLHGQVGTAVARGGDCSTTADSLRTAERLEQPLFNPETGRANAPPLVGFRIALAMSNAVDRERLRQIADDIAELSEIRASQQQALADDPPVERLRRAAEALQATDGLDPAERERLGRGLDQVAAEVETEIQRRSQAERRIAVTSMRAGMQSVRNLMLDLENFKRVDLAATAGRVSAASLENAATRLKISEDLFFALLTNAADEFDRETVEISARLALEDFDRRFQGDSVANTRRLYRAFASTVLDYQETRRSDLRHYGDQVEQLYNAIRAGSATPLRDAGLE